MPIDGAGAVLQFTTLAYAWTKVGGASAQCKIAASFTWVAWVQPNTTVLHLEWVSMKLTRREYAPILGCA